MKTTTPDPEQMHCMEVWGGNRAVERCIETPGLRVWAYSRPHGQAAAGGDVYYLSSCASGRITRMLLADVSGHGEVVSDMAIGLRELMRRNVNYIRQTRFVRAMNQQFADLSQDGAFATALVSTFFAPTAKYTLCNAGHPPPLLLRRRTSEWSELATDVAQSATISNTPLGIVEEAMYRQHDITLEQGDMVLSFSDSVTESEYPNGQQVGCDGILDLVSNLAVNDAEDIIPALIERLTELCDANLQQDDTTFMLCEATGNRVPLKNSMLAPFRLFGSVNDNTLLG